MMKYQIIDIVDDTLLRVSVTFSICLSLYLASDIH